MQKYAGAWQRPVTNQRVQSIYGIFYAIDIDNPDEEVVFRFLGERDVPKFECVKICDIKGIDEQKTC